MEKLSVGQVLHRTVRFNGDDSDCHFASVDGGETWIEIDRAPTQGDRDGISALIDGVVDSKTGARSGHITVSNRHFSTMAGYVKAGAAQVAGEGAE